MTTDQLVELKIMIIPVAELAVSETYERGNEKVSGDPWALHLLELNYKKKKDLLILGCCYATGIDSRLLEALIPLLVDWGALFTMIDTSIDEDEAVLTQRSACERLAFFLVRATETSVLPLTHQATAIEKYLTFLSNRIQSQMSALKISRPMLEAISEFVKAHSQLIVFQHIAKEERASYLSEIGKSDYLELCKFGSPGPLFALIRSAVELGPKATRSVVHQVQSQYFPEFGLLHIWLDDLADFSQDQEKKDLNLEHLSRNSGNEPDLEFLGLLKTYLLRISKLPNCGDVLFPLRLMIREYQKQADDSAVGATFERAFRMVQDQGP